MITTVKLLQKVTKKNKQVQLKNKPLKKQTRSYGSAATEEKLKRTPLYDLHVSLGAKMTGFAGWDMPLEYTDGILQSHLWCRKKASLFDVSHMGQIRIDGKNRAQFLEKLIVGDVAGLPKGQALYSLFTNPKGGIIDDTIVANRGEWIYVVVNAGCYDKDKKHIDTEFGKAKDVKLTYMTDRALVALQGPESEKILSKLSGKDLSGMKFMTGDEINVAGIPCIVQRSGYTGEDGFEISMPADKAEKLAKEILKSPDVRPCGLGARDSLRLEAGLCLYGHDLNDDTTPKSANLVWAISKRRREEGGFLGDKVILPELKGETKTKRIGLEIQGSPAREGATVHDANTKQQIGHVTSGTFSPVLNKPIAMAYIDTAYSKLGSEVAVQVRGRFNKASVVKMPFVPHTYKK